MAPHFAMKDQVLKKFAGYQDLASPIRPDTVPMLNALQMIQTYQDFHLQQQDTVTAKLEAVNHILAQIEFVQDWNSSAASTYTAYADRLLPLYNELAPANEELQCIEQILLPDVLEQAARPLNQNQVLLLAMKQVVTDQIKGLDSRQADLGIRPAKPVRRRRFVRGEESMNILVDCMQISFLGQEMRQRSKTADGKTLTCEDESRQEARLIRNSIKFKESNLVQHQAWVRGWDIVAYNENRRSFIAQGPRRDEHAAAAVLAQDNARKARSDVESTEQHLRHLKREYVRKNELRRFDPYSNQTVLGKHKSDSEGRHGNIRRRRKLGSQTRERILERRMLGEKLANWFMEPDQARSRDAPEHGEFGSRSGPEASTRLTKPRKAGQTARTAPQQPQGSEHLRPRITLVDGQHESSDRASKQSGTSIAAVGASSATSTRPAAPKGFKTNGWTSVNAPALSRQQLSPPTKPRPTTGGLSLPKTAAPHPLQTPSPPPRPRQPSPRPVITPTEGRRRIIVDSPSPAISELTFPIDLPITSNREPSIERECPSSAAPSPLNPAPAQPATSSQAGPSSNNKRKRDRDEEATDPTAAVSSSEAGPSSKRVREQPVPAAALAPASDAAAPVRPPPAPASVNVAPTKAASARKYVRGGVKSKFLGEAEALASDIALDGKTRKSGRVRKKRGG